MIFKEKYDSNLTISLKLLLFIIIPAFFIVKGIDSFKKKAAVCKGLDFDTTYDECYDNKLAEFQGSYSLFLCKQTAEAFCYSYKYNYNKTEKLSCIASDGLNYYIRCDEDKYTVIGPYYKDIEPKNLKFENHNYK